MMGSIGMPSEQLLAAFGRLPLDAPLPAIDAMRMGQVITIRSPRDRVERYPLLESADLPWAEAMVITPMYDISGAPFGTLGIGFASAEALDTLDRGLLVDVATHSALALHRARQNAAAERNQEQLAFLDALSGALSRNLDVDAVLTHLAGKGSQETAKPT
jgi:GAF domain-containing protein